MGHLIEREQQHSKRQKKMRRIWMRTKMRKKEEHV
jgi:hypothetical protein